MVIAAVRANEEAIQPLTEAQLGIWMALTLTEDKTSYNIGDSVEILGRLDAEVFERALRQVVAETDALRLRFSETGAGPRQWVLSEVDWAMPILDFASEPNPHEAAESWMREAMAQVVDVTSEPVFRYALLRVAPERFIWFTCYHHLCTDGFGATLIIRRAAEIYSALLMGEPIPEMPLASCLELLVAEREYRQSKAYERDRNYWLAQLAARPERVTLAGEPPSVSEGFVRCSAVIPDVVVQRLRAGVRRSGPSLPQAFVAAAGIYVHRLTGATDLVLGTTVAARTSAKMQRVVGVVANVTPLRLQIEAANSVDKHMRQTSLRLLQALHHQRYRAETLRRDLGLKPSDPEFFGPKVNILSFDSDVRFGGHPVRARNIANWRVDDLEIVVHDHRDNAEIVVDFVGNPRLYSADVLAAHRDRYIELLDSLSMADADAPLHGLNLFRPGEREQVLVEWNRTEAAFPEHLCIHELFEQQVARDPAAVALTYEKQTLSFGELNARANQLARHLVSLGVRPDDRVGLCVERSLEMVIGLVAVLKAGGAYVPLDPTYPPDRLAFMLADSAPGIVLANASARPALVAPLSGLANPPRLLDLVADSAMWAGEPSTNLNRETLGLGPRHLAYVIYTSGSTGRPKGVMIEHRNLVNYVTWDIRSYYAEPGNGSPTTFSISFDAQVTTFYGALMSGQTLDIYPTGTDIEALAARTTKPYRLTKVTPSHLKLLNPKLRDRSGPSPTAALMLGGEALSPSDIAFWQERFPGVRLINHYGPTETTVGCCTFEITSDMGQRSAVPIGRPNANARIYLLDGQREPVPVGVVGEIYIGGAGVARGYLNCAELTAERFIESPFVPGDRLYRTGDLARRLPDGIIVYLGRADQQVKIRGFRVEPGEVVSALVRHPSVAQAVVAAKDDRAGMKQLVAYVIPRDKSSSAEILRDFLLQSLPNYMVPSRFVFLDAFPLTPNSKVDMKALPTPSEEPAERSKGSLPPRTHLETQLTALWRQVLENEAIGIRDNFFEAGGHSLKAVQLVSHIERAYGVRLPLAVLFQAPTVEQLAAVLTTSGWNLSWRCLVAIQPSGSNVPIFGIAGARGNVLVFAKLARLLGSSQPFYGLQAKGLDGQDAPFRSVHEAAQHYIAEIRGVRPQGPYIIGGACTGGVFAYEVAQRLAAAGEQVLLITMDTWHPSTYQRVKSTTRLWPLRFIGSRLSMYAQELRRLPLRDWTSFVRQKVGNAVRSVVRPRSDTKTLEVSDLASGRVAQAIRRAVSGYTTEPYPGSLLNVIARARLMRIGTIDTRREWEKLAKGKTRMEEIPARDSGQLFVSPHVEVLAEHISRFIAESCSHASSTAGWNDQEQQAAPVELGSERRVHDSGSYPEAGRATAVYTYPSPNAKRP